MVEEHSVNDKVRGSVPEESSRKCKIRKCTMVDENYCRSLGLGNLSFVLKLGSLKEEENSASDVKNGELEFTVFLDRKRHV